LKKIKKPKTTIIFTKNNGVSEARNIAIKKAKGKYILPLDADDTIEPTYLEKASKILDGLKSGIVYCKARLFGDVNEEWYLPEYSFTEITKGNVIFCSAMFRKSDWLKVGGYKKELIHGLEDWEFWLSLIENGAKVFRIPEILFNYRIKQNSRNDTINNKKDILKKTKWQIRLLHKKIMIISFLLRFIFTKKVSKNGRVIIKLFKIPIWFRKGK
jgi:glycosyltransferase involved in cell wall biosynthesis